MAEAKQRERWNHTASLLAQMHNLLAKRPKKPAEFHPMETSGREHSFTNVAEFLAAWEKLKHGR